MDRFDRIYQLHKLLTNRRVPIPLTAIMQELECAKATAARYIEDMRIYLDAPLEYDRKLNGYYYNQQADKPYQLPGLWFSAEELNGLLICQRILQNISPGLLSRQIAELQQRIDRLFKLHPHAPADISQKIKILSIGRRLKDDAQFKKIASALFNGKQLDIEYTARGQNAAQTRRTVSPQQLVYYRDNWYLAAYCHVRKQLRVFAVDNVGLAKMLDRNAVSVESEQLEQFLTASYGIFSGAARHVAVLEFSPARAKWVADECWHPDQQGQWLTNGNYQLSIPFSDSRELIMDILKHGAEVEVKAPGFLIDQVREQIDAMQKIYKK
ncbi:MAG: helix-turn-helix transcriptional regulator [Methylobacter sp.]